MLIHSEFDLTLLRELNSLKKLIGLHQCARLYVGHQALGAEDSCKWFKLIHLFLCSDELIEFDLAIENLLYQITRPEDVGSSFHHLFLHLQVSKDAYSDSFSGSGRQYACPSNVLVTLARVDIESDDGFDRLGELSLLRDLLHLLNGVLGGNHLVEIEDLCCCYLSLAHTLRGSCLLRVEYTQYYEMKSCAISAYPHSYWTMIPWWSSLACTFWVVCWSSAGGSQSQTSASRWGRLLSEMRKLGAPSMNGESAARGRCEALLTFLNDD